MSRPSGILLAGGASRRFGRPKLIEPLRGAPLFHFPLGALLDSCDDVVIVLAPDVPEPPLPAGADRARFVRDVARHQGPLAGARVGLEEVRREYAIVAAGDMPGLRPELLSLMTDRAFVGHRRAVVLSDAGGARPIPSVLRVAPALALARTLLESGERRLRALVAGLEPEEVPETVWMAADGEGAWRRDVDSPEDLEG